MKAMGLYLLFLISLAGITLCDDPFSEKSKNQFLNHLLDFHQNMRQKQRLSILERTNSLDEMATILLNKKLFENKNEFPKSHGVNYYEGQFNNTELDYSLANIVFQYWQSLEFDTDISNEQRKSKIESYLQMIWGDTKNIGLAVGRNDTHFAIIVLYYPRYNSIDQGGPSTR